MGVVPEGSLVERLVVRRVAHDREVELEPGERRHDLLAVADPHLELDARAGPLEGGEGEGRPIFGGTHHTDRHRSPIEPAQGRHRGGTIGERRLDPGQGQEHFLARFARSNAVALAHRQRDPAERLLEQLQLLAHGRRGEAQGLGRGADRAGSQVSAEGAELTQRGPPRER